MTKKYKCVVCGDTYGGTEFCCDESDFTEEQ